MNLDNKKELNLCIEDCKILFPKNHFHLKHLFHTLSEQTTIAQHLDQKTKKIDQTIAQKEKLISLLKERKQIMIQELVTGKKVWNKETQSWTKPSQVKDSGVETIGEIHSFGGDLKALKYIRLKGE